MPGRGRLGVERSGEGADSQFLPKAHVNGTRKHKGFDVWQLFGRLSAYL